MPEKIFNLNEKEAKIDGRKCDALRVVTRKEPLFFDTLKLVGDLIA